MADYAFRLLDAHGAVLLCRTLSLPRDVDASVRSFDFLRDEPRAVAVTVDCGDRPLLTRTRAGRKSLVVWAPRAVAPQLLPRRPQALGA